MNRIEWGAPDWALPTALLGGVLLLAIVWAYYLPGTRLGVRVLAAGLKIAAVILLALCLLEPLVSGTRPRPQANVFAILIDNSRSMQTKNRSGITADVVNKWLSERDSGWLARLEQDFDVRMYSFDRELRRLDPPAKLDFAGLSSRLLRALESVQTRFQNRPVAGALVLSDGNATDERTALSDLPFPVYAVAGPESEQLDDLRIEQVRVSQTNFETSPTTVWVTVAGHGFEKETLVLELVGPDGAVVEQQTLKLTAAEPEPTLRFRFRPDESGVSFYRLNLFAKKERKAFEQQQLGREATWANNRREVLVDRGGGPFRILYIAGRPNWDFKFLRRALQDDDEIQLVGLLRIANKEPKFSFRDRAGVEDTNKLFEGFEQRDPEDAESYDQPVLIRLGITDESELRDGFPKRAEDLFAYHAIVLDDLEASFFSPDQMLLIRRFVSQRGGGLLMMGGQASFAQGQYHRTPLGELLPVYVDPNDVQRPAGSYEFQLTREGWLEPWVRLRSTETEEEERIEGMPSFATRNPIGGVKPGAVVVAEVEGRDETSPAIVSQRFGKGRTAALVLGDMWRWAMRRKQQDSNDLSTFWRQSMRWLTADVPRRVEISVEPTGDSSVEMRLTVREEDYRPYDGAQIQLTVSDPDDEEFQLTADASDEPGVYTASYWPQADGGYRVSAKVTAADGSEMETREAGWTSLPSARELQRIEPNRELLERIAVQTGGEVVDPENLARFVASLPSRKVPETERWVYPLWHQPFVLGLALICLCAEWGLRRWKGLV